MLMASKPLLAKKSGIKGIFPFSFPRTVTDWISCVDQYLVYLCYFISWKHHLKIIYVLNNNLSCIFISWLAWDIHRVVIDIGKGGNGARWYTTPRSHYKFNGIGKTVLSRYDKDKAYGSMSFVQLLDQALYTNNPIPYLLSMTLYWKTMQTQVVPNQW